MCRRASAVSNLTNSREVLSASYLGPACADPRRHGERAGIYFTEDEMAKKALEDRIVEMEEEVDAELDRMAEEVRPKDEHAAIPAGTIRRMWEARAGGNLFHALLIAKGKFT